MVLLRGVHNCENPRHSIDLHQPPKHKSTLLGQINTPRQSFHATRRDHVILKSYEDRERQCMSDLVYLANW